MSKTFIFFYLLRQNSVFIQNLRAFLPEKMSRKGKSTDKVRLKKRSTEQEDAPRPKKALKTAKPPKYNHPQYWLSEEANLQ
jgi:hypothetical protein